MARVLPPPSAIVGRAEACRRLGISVTTFWRRWQAIFTDPRDASDRKEGIERPVYEDELQVAVDRGGRHAARIAVLNYRGRIGRADGPAATQPARAARGMRLAAKD